MSDTTPVESTDAAPTADADTAVATDVPTDTAPEDHPSGPGREAAKYALSATRPEPNGMRSPLA